MSAPRVLIVSASAGSGHVRAGTALLGAFRAAGAAAEHVDVLRLAPRWVRAAYAGGFELIASRAPRVWREIYERSDGPDCDSARWGGLAATVLFREFRRLLLDGDFDFCVCTHFLPAQLAAGREGLPPFATAITDHAVHRYWVQRGVDSYFVANRQMADELRRRLPQALVEVSGIPVDPALGSPPERRAARCGLQLDADLPVVLVMGGGFGLGVEAAANAVLAARTPDLHVLVVCGRNSAAQRRLTRMVAQSPELSRTLRVAGFVNDIGRYMAAADLIVTKPGGLTTSEALALSRPLLLTRGMPGHEVANVRFLTAVDAALSTPASAAVSAGVERFFDDAHLRASLRSGAALAATPFAAQRIAHAVLNRLAARAAA